MRILIAEDKPCVRKEFQSTFTCHGIKNITFADDGMDLVEKYFAKMNEVDLVLLSDEMPFLSELEAARYLTRLNPHIAIILISDNEKYSLSTLQSVGILDRIPRHLPVSEMVLRLFESLTRMYR